MSGDYRVGRGRPPVASRFQKGQSGNPGGRPRQAVSPVPGVSTFDGQLLTQLDRTATVAIDGSTTIMTFSEVIAHRLATLAAKGNLSAAKQMLARAERAAAALREAQQACFSYWHAYEEQHHRAPLNWPAPAGRAPLYPHPRDMQLDPLTLEVRFIGPMTARDAPPFLAAPLLRNYLFRLAERQARCGDRAGAVWLRRQAVRVHGLVVPSYGGPASDHRAEAIAHGLAALRLSIAALAGRALDADLAQLRDRLGSTLSVASARRGLSAPHPERLARPRRPARRSLIERAPALRTAICQALARGESLAVIEAGLTDPAPSRAALGRYAQRYRRTVTMILADLATPIAPGAAPPQGSGIPADVPALLRAQRDLHQQLATRDISALEQWLRTQINAQERLEDPMSEGVSEAQLDVIRRKILGIER